MGSPSLPAFATERRPGLLDFWTVYERVAEELPAPSAHELPALRPSALGELATQWSRSRALLRGAILEGSWQPYVEHLRAVGARFAELAMPLSTWSAVVRILQHRVLSGLVEAYGATPSRLTAALLAATEVNELSMALVAARYCETAQEDRLRLLVDGIKDYAIFMLDRRGQVTSWNAGAEALYGYAADEIIGEHYEVFFAAAAREAGVPARSLEVAAETGRFDEQAPRLRKDGSPFWAEVTVTAIRDTGQALVGFAKVVRDLSERQKAEAERRAQEERFRALANATPDAIVTADHHGVITYANHATAALFGRPAAELVGQPLTVLMPERMREAHTRGLSRYLATSEAGALGRTIEMPALRSDGTERAVEMSVTTWLERGVCSFAAIMRDVSERKQIEATLEQRTRQLERTNRETEAFSYSVAHELRAPLRGINAFASVLVEDHAGELSVGALEHLERIQTNARRMAALIDALLALSRLSRSELELRPVDLSALARAAVAQLAAAEPHRAVDVQIEAGLRATANSRLVRTLLENLIGNAWKFTGKTAAPQIVVGSTNGTTFFVRDNGAGFELAHAGKLFAPFERLHSAEDFPGTGIGLATVQRIVHHHGGRIWVRAQVNAGATFFFTLAPTES